MSGAVVDKPRRIAGVGGVAEVQLLAAGLHAVGARAARRQLLVGGDARGARDSVTVARAPAAADLEAGVATTVVVARFLGHALVKGASEDIGVAPGDLDAGPFRVVAADGVAGLGLPRTEPDRVIVDGENPMAGYGVGIFAEGWNVLRVRRTAMAGKRPLGSRPDEADDGVGRASRVDGFQVDVVIQLALAVRVVGAVVEPHAIDVGGRIVVPAVAVAVAHVLVAVLVEADSIPNARKGARVFDRPAGSPRGPGRRGD